jgi:hypothetical protein
MSEFDRPLASLFTELTRETATLIRQEVRLAKEELNEKVSTARSGLVAAVAGGLVLFVALQALIAAAILGVATRLDPWLSALVVGVALALVGAVVLAKGLSNLQGRRLLPNRTMDTMRDNGRWAREQLR